MRVKFRRGGVGRGRQSPESRTPDAERAIYRNLHDGGEEPRDGVVREDRDLGIQIQQSTYKIMYERGREDVLWRRRRAEEAGMLRERAVAREDERRRRGGRLLER